MTVAKRFKLAAVLGASVGLVCAYDGAASAASSSLNTAASIRRSIEQIGTRATVDLLWDSRQSDVLFDHVARGEPGWIALVPRLREGSDAVASEELELMLVFALPLNARAVLAAMDPTTGPDTVCTMRFIDEVEPAPPGYKKRSLKALALVTDPRLRSQRDACSAALRAAR